MSDPTQGWLARLLDGDDLAEDEADGLMRALTDDTLAPARAGALLAALRAKGETAAEIRGFARAMRALALAPALPPGLAAVDVVGTGGDNSGSLNLSTGSALLAAACGVPVVKHGNRSVSSNSGSADVLRELGLPMPLDEAAAAACFEATGFTFLFAPHYHPAMKAIAPVRAALGVRTVFNVLGPLANPASPPFHVIGAYSADMARLMAATLAGLPGERAFVIHGEPGWDEATPVGEFLLLDVQNGRVREEFRRPEDYGLGRCAPEALAGGDAAHNAEAMRAVLTGADAGPHRDALALGVALTLELTGRAGSPRAGIAAALAAIDDGRAAALLTALADFGAGR